MRFIFCSILLMCSITVSAQIGARFFTEIPLEGNPAFFDQSYGGELLYIMPIDRKERFSARAGVSVLNHQFKYREVPDYAIIIDNNPPIAYEGVTEHERYQEIFASVGGNCNLVNMDAFKAYVGADFLIGIFQYKYRSEIDNVSNRDVVEDGSIFGYRLRAGIGYFPIETIQVLAETHWGKRSNAGWDGWPALDFGAGLVYYFN